MDFSKLSARKTSSKPIDPIEIFKRLPSLEGTPNDLWHGQSVALSEWHANRNKENDILVSLNTGAGKTIVGLLIAQSLVNEGIENVVYACSTIDLVEQTAKEADKLGIHYTKRVKGGFSNTSFEQGEAFCITTYSALFNSLSHIMRNYYPGALILDDAHVAEQNIRDQFTLRLEKSKNDELYNEVCGLYKTTFEEIGKGESFKDLITGTQEHIYISPPNATIGVSQQLATLLRNHQVPNDDNLKYSYNHLKDNLANCCIIFSSDMVEITPPFLPIKTLPCFTDPNLKRVYLSATLTSKADIARAFGMVPQIIVKPDNDAGNGERLILYSEEIKSKKVNKDLMDGLVEKNKVLISVPSYAQAKKWKAYAEPPDSKNFTSELEEFRNEDSGVFILVYRLDGIDLPDNTCRIMVIDGIPSGASLLEKFQWDVLGMKNLYSSKIANRLTQLFGRINRGRNDYSAFIIDGRQLNTWLSNKRNLSLMPELLRNQLLIGKEMQNQMEIQEASQVVEAIETVLSRNPDWLDFYRDSIENDTEISEDTKAIEIDELLTQAAIAEVKFVSCLWENDTTSARRELESNVEDVKRADVKVAGWHNVWIGMCYEREGDTESAFQEYERARTRLARQIYLPRSMNTPENSGNQEQLTQYETSLLEVVSVESENTFSKQIRKFNKALSPLQDENATPRQAEEAVRSLGEFLGFNSTRPDNDLGTGPDVLWIDEDNSAAIAFELKTDKSEEAKYNKADISQGHDHIEWFEENHGGIELLGLIYVGPPGECSDKTTPDKSMYHCELSAIKNISDFLISSLEAIRSDVPLNRPNRIKDFFNTQKYTLADLFNRLAETKMTDLQD